MRNYIRVVLVSIFAFAVHSTPSLAAFAEQPGSKKLKAGFILPLSGPFAEFGEAQRNGIELARSEKPELFLNLELIYEDGAHDGSRTASAFHKLKSVDHVDLVYVFGAEPALIVAPLAEAARLPMIASAQAAPASLSRTYVIRSINYTAQYSKKLLDYFSSRRIHRLALIQAEMSYYNLLVEGLRAGLTPGQTLEIVDTYPPADSNLRSSVTKLRTKNYDALGLFLAPKQILEVLRELKSQKAHPPIFGAAPFQSSSLNEQSEGAMNGAVYVHNIVIDAYRNRYLERFGNDHQIPWAANAFDVANLIGEVSSRSNFQPSPEEILGALRFSGTRSGAGGNYTFHADRLGGQYFEYPLAVYRIEDGEHKIN